MIQVIQILILNLETGCTLNQSLMSAFQPYLSERDDSVTNKDSIVSEINRKAKKLNHKNFFRLVRLINQYQKNGSSSTLRALEKYHADLYLNSMTEMKKKAERATLKLTLLLMLSLISIITVIMTPVVILLKSAF